MLSADLLKRYSQAWDDNEKTKHYDRIKQTILSMTKMLENVTILSKIESKEIDIFPERINLTQFAQAMAETAALNMPSANVIQVINLNQNIEEIVSDENLLGLSLINVIYNAIKFSDSDKGIEIETEVKEKIANIKIKDSGKGIKEQDLPYVTQAFYRGDNTVNVPGYGLGLAITKKSIEMLGGTLHINSTQNLGTVVSISIPRYFL
jgi:signal transduction histidine kinase